jgi:pimeloyl-ACP methyl ester carboxylesterase
MAKSTRLAKSLTRLLLPALLLVAIAVAGGSVWLVYATAHPLNSRYLVTPDKYGQLSSRAAQVTEEKWTNRDGSQARGWLLRGGDGSPAVILFHKFGADRSYVLNLGVKLNESTNFTVLMPDQRAHGENPPIKNASFGGCETEDGSSAIEFVRGLKTANEIPLVGRNLGVFGVEMGAIVALSMASKDESIKAIALDSVPQDSDSVLEESVDRRFPFASFATTELARLGTYMYFFDGCYRRESMCDVAHRVQGRDVMLLSGVDAQQFQDSTARLARCFPAANRVETKFDLSPSGFGIINASIEQSEAYDQRLIDFFRASLGN